MSDLLLGIEIGGTKLQLGLGRGDGRLLALKRVAAEPSGRAQGIRSQLARAFESLRDEVPESSIAAVGIGFGGPVDTGRGVVTKSFQVEGWEGFPLVDWVRDTFGIRRVSLHNDADTAALGEARFGAGVGLSPILYVNSGSGVGGGLVISGQIYRGSGAGALEIGHVWVSADAYDGSYAQFGRLEDLASGWAIGRAGRAIVEHYRDGWDSTLMTTLADGDPERVTAATVVEAAALGDHQAWLVLSQATRAMGRALAHAVTLLAPRRIILGGGVSLSRPDLWLDRIQEELEDRVFPPFRGTFDVVPASLGEEVVVHGALALAKDALEAQ